MNNTLSRRCSIFGWTFAVCMIQSVSHEHIASADANGPILLPAGAGIPSGYGLTSGGIYRHKSCVVPVPNRARVWPDMIVRDENNNELRNLQQPCGYPAYRIATTDNTEQRVDTALPEASPETNGYVVWLTQSVPAGYGGWTELETEVIVPGTPNDENASIAWWSGIASSNVGTSANVVLQPQIIWGPFVYNAPNGSNGSYQMLTGVQFNGQPPNLGWYICSGGGSDTGDVGSNSDPGGCALTQVNKNDTVEFVTALVEITSGCGNELTVSGIQNVCGEWAWYGLLAEDLNQGSGTAQVLFVGQVYSNGPDAPPNGGVFPLAMPAVYESYSDTSCESGTGFGIEAMQASNSSSFFNNVAYNPTVNVGPGNIPSCHDNAAVGDFTAVW
jgi:hypothetical protein